MRTLGPIAALIMIASAALAAPTFESHWRDGRAELDGYRLTIERYGEIRQGEAVMIFVTEPFSESQLVKVDDPSANPADTFEALKLNLVRDFQTGVYDYNTMVSVFTHAADFSPAKITFTSAEWCGHVYEELRFRPEGIESQIFSYFEGESGASTLTPEPDGVAEDNLFITLRGLRGAPLEPGETREVAFLPSAFQRRLWHQPLAWTTAEIERQVETEIAEVPAGEFETIVYEVRVADGRTGRFNVELEYPHRIVRWDWRSEIGELTGSERMAYWQLNGAGDESHLEALGLERN
ncbi:hypothetical protein JXA47_12410 [Candidatus Sumerlaeota bacterium]|nr:hypothetical protein [Candidatus Sumerlaeota bacterium]